MTLEVLVAVAFLFVSVLLGTYWAVAKITDSLDNISAAVRGQVVKPVSIVPPSWGKRH